RHGRHHRAHERARARADALPRRSVDAGADRDRLLAHLRSRSRQSRPAQGRLRTHMELRGARIAVTGATGFLGRYIVDVLLGRGAHVIGVVRNPDRVPELAARGVELRKADLAEPDRLAAGFAGANAVVSNAALFSLGNQRWDEHERANVVG